jgi:hypothetical protein
MVEEKEIINRIKSLERKRETLVRKGAWMAIYILAAKIETLKDKIISK